MRRRLTAVILVACGLAAQPAAAYWTAGGSGSGMLGLATLPAGPTPSVGGTARDITVSFDQVSFNGTFLGTRAQGGYHVLRRPSGGGAAVEAGGTCAGTLGGSAATLSCVDAGAPLGTWRYSIVPVLGSWTGDEGPVSAVVTARLAAPVLAPAEALNPASGADVGNIRLTWQAVTGASGYSVYRRSGGGALSLASGATPVAATSWTDSGLAAGTTYEYVIRAVQADPAGEGEPSAARSATPIVRPAAPGTPTATALSGARVSVQWAAVTGADGYNVYRRTTAGSYDLASPLNGATPVTGTSLTDTTSAHGTSYRYVVRAVATGAGGAPVESASSPESAAVTADGQAPAAPLTVTVGGSGPVLAAATCGMPVGTRFVNAAVRAAVPVTVTLAAPEAGQTVTLTAATPGGTSVVATVAATPTTSATLNLSGLPDGALTITAATADVLGNASAATTATGTPVLDTIAALGSITYVDLAGADKLDGASECGATITAAELAPRAGRSYGPVTVGTSGTFTGLTVDTAKKGAAYSYDVTAADLAGNATTVRTSGTAVR